MTRKETFGLYGIALAAMGLAVLAPQGVIAAPAAKVSLTAHVIAAPGQAKAGQAKALALALSNQGGKVSGAVVDLEVYDAHGTKVAQNFWLKQAIVAGGKASYRWSWTPKTSGVYTVRVGVFGASWKPLYFWDNAALALKVS